MGNPRVLRLALIGLGLILGALLLRVGMSWFFDNFVQETREVRSGFQSEAWRNPLLAAERYLGRVGVEVESVSTSDLWRNLPDPGDTIVVYRYSPPVGEVRRQALRDWIEAGGHLIIEADDSVLIRTDMNGREKRPGTGRGGLLSELGVSLHQDDTVFIAKMLLQNKPTEIEFADFDGKVLVDFGAGGRYLEIDEEKAEPSEVVPCGKGYCVLQYDLGEGLVTVLSNIAFLNNHNIGKHDHALALALLSPDPPLKTWLVYDVEMPSLISLMWRNGPYALSALLLLLLLLLWQKGGRLGPLLPPLQQPRRNIDEHLWASAGFLWRIDRGKQLFLGNQQNLKQAWYAKHFLLRSMPRNESCAWIAARAGLSPEAVEQALYGTCGSEQEYIELSSYLQILRMAL